MAVLRWTALINYAVQ